MKREGAAELLDEYLAGVGGREKIIEQTNEAIKTKKRGRKSTSATAATAELANKRSKRNGHPAETTPPVSATKAGVWQPPAGSWEDHIETIDACEDEATGKLVVFLNWKNGKKTKHSTEVVYKRCPQKVKDILLPRVCMYTWANIGLWLFCILDAALLRKSRTHCQT